MDNIIVTGSSGFLGKRLCELWGDQDNIVKIDIAGNPDYNIDLCNHDQVVGVVREISPKLIIHLAAYSHVLRSDNPSKQSPLEILGHNVLSTYNMLQAASEVCPMILAGSAAEYGSWPNDVEPPTETDHCNPEEPYGISKYIGSLLVEDRYWQCATAVVVRFSNLYGPGQRGKFIPMLIETALAGKQLVLHGKGRQTRQFLYVDDAIAAIRIAAKCAILTKSYNITAPEEYSIRDVAVLVYSALQDEALKMGRDLPLLDLKLEEHGGGANRVCMDVERAYRRLGWLATVPLEQGIKYTVEAAMAEKYAYPAITDHT